MKLLMAVQTFAPQAEGGAELSARMAAYELQKRHKVVVLSLGHPDDPVAPVGRSDYDGISIVRVPFKAAYLPGPEQPKLSSAKRGIWHLQAIAGATNYGDVRTAIRAEEPDLVYSQNTARMQPALWNAARDLRIPVVQHIRDYAYLCPRVSMYKNDGNCEKRCFECSIFTKRFASASRGVSSAIAVSDFVRQRFLEHGMFRDASWHVMHNTNTSGARFDTHLRERRVALLRSDTFTFGYLGNLSREKGIEDLLAAFRSIPLRNARLVIGGRGSEDYVKGLAHPLRGLPVEFLGQVPARQIYEQADVIVSPSRWHEPQSRVLVEAAVYGIPVIASNRGGSSEIVAAGQTGWIYDPDTPGDLAQMLSDITAEGVDVWRARQSERFPGLDSFRGTAEDSHFYDRLGEILLETVRNHKDGDAKDAAARQK